jgi:organic hydroperoxide reductase OsmC/OhrA
MSEENHNFTVDASWDTNEKDGRVENPSKTFSVRHTGAVSLGGVGGSANPEELLLSGLSACFVQTWAIFLAKLKVPIERPALTATCVVEKDPAGGFHVTSFTIAPRIPSALWNERRADVEKTLQLAEKYCIVSKAVKGEGRTLTVTPKVD